MNTVKILRFTSNFERKHRNTFRSYHESYEDVVSAIESNINSNSYGISEYPISNAIEEQNFEEMKMDFFERKLKEEGNEEVYEKIYEIFINSQSELTPEIQYKEAILDTCPSVSSGTRPKYWWEVFSAIPYEIFLKRISPKREAILKQNYGNKDVIVYYNLYLDFIENYWEGEYVSSNDEYVDTKYFQDKVLKIFWDILLNKKRYEFSNDTFVDYSDGLPATENWYDENNVKAYVV